jgi:hypothetical protein
MHVATGTSYSEAAGFSDGVLIGVSERGGLERMGWDDVPYLIRRLHCAFMGWKRCVDKLFKEDSGIDVTLRSWTGQ